jgi:excisionase family DNA binding protein
MSWIARALLDELANDPEAIDRLRNLVATNGTDSEPWVGVERAAEHLGCRRQRIYNLVSERAIPHRKDGSRLLFRLSELDAWLDVKQ